MSIPTITRSDLDQHLRDGFRITSTGVPRDRTKNYIALKLREESSIWEDVGRSAGYTLGAPVVFATSIALSALTICVGALTVCAGGAVVEERGIERRMRYENQQAEFAVNLAEDCIFEAPKKVFMKLNEGFYDWVKPYQTRVAEKTVKIKIDPIEHNQGE